MSSKTNKAGLGRGFDALIPTNFDNTLLLDESERVQKLFISVIEPNKNQPRVKFDDVALKELAASIKRHGILQPLVVSPLAGDKYMIVAGERRWRAAKIAGLDTVPAIVRTTKEIERLEIALIENVQRVDLSPLEQAVSIQKLHDQFNMSYDDVAKRLGKAGPTIANIVRLLQLPKSAREALQNEKITEGHARAILALKADPEKQEELLKLIIRNNWTVRQAEQFVVACRQGNKSVAVARKHTQATTPQTKKLSVILSAPVTIKRLAKGGKLEIGFKDEDDYKRLTKLLTKLK